MLRDISPCGFNKVSASVSAGSTRQLGVALCAFNLEGAVRKRSSFVLSFYQSATKPLPNTDFFVNPDGPYIIATTLSTASLA